MKKITFKKIAKMLLNGCVATAIIWGGVILNEQSKLMANVVMLFYGSLTLTMFAGIPISLILPFFIFGWERESFRKEIILGILIRFTTLIQTPLIIFALFFDKGAKEVDISLLFKIGACFGILIASQVLLLSIYNFLISFYEED